MFGHILSKIKQQQVKINTLKILTNIDVVQCLLVWSEYNGFPLYIHSDEGREFVNVIISTFCGLNKIANITSGPYNPSLQGKVEHINGHIEKLLGRLYIDFKI